jgi:geranylgeranyl diphosphate synthase type 3
VPVAHHIFGVASTINCANYVYFESLDMLYKLHNPTAIGVFVGKCTRTSAVQHGD